MMTDTHISHTPPHTPPHTLVILPNWGGQVIFEDPACLTMQHDDQGRLVITRDPTVPSASARPSSSFGGARFWLEHCPSMAYTTAVELEAAVQRQERHVAYSRSREMLTWLLIRGWEVVKVKNNDTGAPRLWVRYAGNLCAVNLHANGHALFASAKATRTFLGTLPNTATTATVTRLPFCSEHRGRSQTYFDQACTNLEAMENWADHEATS